MPRVKRASAVLCNILERMENHVLSPAYRKCSTSSPEICSYICLAWLNADELGRLVTICLSLLLQAEIEEAARLANAHAFICALPQGYATQACLPVPFGMRRAEQLSDLSCLTWPRLQAFLHQASASKAGAALLQNRSRAVGSCILIIEAHMSKFLSGLQQSASSVLRRVRSTCCSLH